MDASFCDDCGDVMCYDCMTECTHCGQRKCSNCSENNVECIRCHVNTPKPEKAYLVINGEHYPVKNSQFLIEKTNEYDRELSLKLDGKEYKFSYRSLCQRKDQEIYDYYIHFIRVVKKEDTNYYLDEIADDFDDYGII
jgi:hypothetical protein